MSCRQCFYLAKCGGREGNLDLFGCHFHPPEQCTKHQWTCPWCRSHEFIRRMREVGGWPPPPPARMLGIAHEFPIYVPNLKHAYNVAGTMRLPIVALPTNMVVNGRGKSFGTKFETAAALRRAFCLHRNTKVLLVSVKEDQYLECFWKYHRENDIAARLAKLDIVGVTVPNFSYFSDAPRPHTLYNQGRLDRAIERLSAAGISVVPHLNALTNADWEHWRRVLHTFPHVRHVCKEFQTHNGTEDLQRLARLQDELKRPLHPVLIGAGTYASRLREVFEQSTIVSSTPWFRAVKGREKAWLEGDRMRWQKVNVPNGRQLRELVQHNLREYTRYMTMRVTGEVPAQLDFFEVLGRAFSASDSTAKRQAEPLLWSTRKRSKNATE